MATTRRDLLATSGSLAGYAALQRLGLAQAVAPIANSGDAAAVAPPTRPAAKALYADIGPAAWAELNRRLRTVNDDLVTYGLRHIPGVDGTLLTGYPYNEFYDWDLTSRICISYYGVGPLCFTNLKEFLDREQPDGSDQAAG